MDVAGEPFAFAGGGLDLQGAGQGAFTGAGDLGDVPDGDGGDPDQQDVVVGVPAGLAALDDVGDGDEGGGEGRPPPAALDREGEDRAAVQIDGSVGPSNDCESKSASGVSRMPVSATTRSATRKRLVQLAAERTFGSVASVQTKRNAR